MAKSILPNGKGRSPMTERCLEADERLRRTAKTPRPRQGRQEIGINGALEFKKHPGGVGALAVLLMILRNCDEC
jgi:hypothetical protein